MLRPSFASFACKRNRIIPMLGIINIKKKLPYCITKFFITVLCSILLCITACDCIHFMTPFFIVLAFIIFNSVLYKKEHLAVYTASLMRGNNTQFFKYFIINSYRKILNTQFFTLKQNIIQVSLVTLYKLRLLMSIQFLLVC